MYNRRKLIVGRVSAVPTDKNPGSGEAANILHTSQNWRSIIAAYTLSGTPLYQYTSDVPDIMFVARRQGLLKWLDTSQNIYRSVSFFVRSYKIIFCSDIDVLHLHSPYHLLFGVYAWIKDIPVVMTFHGSEFYQIRKRKKLRFLLFFVTKFCLVAESMRSDAIQIFGNRRVIYVGNGFTPPITYDSALNEEEASQELSICFVGTIRWQKNVQLLLEVFNQVLGQNQSIKRPMKLHICGSGPELDAIKLKAKEMGISSRIIFHGTISRKRLGNILKSTDIFMLTSRTEGLPKALLEAMSLGCIPVVSDVGDCKKVINQLGFCFNNEDLEQATRALSNAINVLASKSINHHRKKIISRANEYSWYQYCKTHEYLYRDLIERKR